MSSRIRSKKLLRFLQQNGGFDNNPRELKRLKREYRRLYQNQHARKQRQNKHEIRFTLTKQEYASLKNSCEKDSIKPTALAKELLINHSNQVVFIPHKEVLLSVAKHLGLAINRLKSGDSDPQSLQKLELAEEQLLNYLKI